MTCASEAKALASTLMGDPSSDGLVYRAVRRAAAEGRRCPSNRDLADMAGLASTGQIPNVFKRLQQRGALKVESSNRERRVTIVANGQQTSVSETFVALDPRRFAARGRKISDALLSANRAQAGSVTSLKPLPIVRPTPVLVVAPPASADHRPPAPSREPCPRCAIRGDLGCMHFAPYEMEDA